MCLCVIIYRIYTWLIITTSDRVPMSERDTHTARERERDDARENTLYIHVCTHWWCTYTYVMLSSALTRSLETLTLMIQVYALPSLSNLILLWKWKWNQRANQHKIIILIFIYQGQGRHTTTTRLDLENWLAVDMIIWNKRTTYATWITLLTYDMRERENNSNRIEWELV